MHVAKPPQSTNSRGLSVQHTAGSAQIPDCVKQRCELISKPGAAEKREIKASAAAHQDLVKVMKTWKVFREEPETSTGFAIWAFMPDSSAFRRSSSNAFAVMATIGIPAFSRECTDRFCGLIAVHVWHLNIHQNNIVIIFWCVLDCFLSRGPSLRARRECRFFQNGEYNFCIQVIILGKQHAFSGKRLQGLPENLVFMLVSRKLFFGPEVQT